MVYNLTRMKCTYFQFWFLQVLGITITIIIMERQPRARVKQVRYIHFLTNFTIFFILTLKTNVSFNEFIRCFHQFVSLIFSTNFFSVGAVEKENKVLIDPKWFFFLKSLKIFKEKLQFRNLRLAKLSVEFVIFFGFFR